MKSLTQIINPERERFFYRNGEKFFLKSANNKVLIKFHDDISKEEKQDTFSSLKEKSGLITGHKLNNDLLNGVFHLLEIDDRHPQTRTAEGRKQLTVDTVSSNINFIESVFENTDAGTYLALTDQLFIKLKPQNEIDTIKSKLNSFDIIRIEDMGNHLYLLTKSSKTDLDTLDIANNLFESGLVEFADPNFFRALQSSLFVPNDPKYYQEWHIPRIGADSAWCWTNAAYGQIGIMDIGINISHPDLAGNYGGTYDPTGQPLGVDAHGTLCAGVACAITNNGIGVAGIAWGAKFYSLRIGYNNTGNPDSTSFYSLDSWIIGAFNYALSSTYISVISCSFSLGHSTSSLDNAILSFAIHARNNNGGLIFASTGNTYNTNIGYPASNANVFAVAATDQSDNRASFSNYGSKVAIAAPGVNIPTTTYNGDYTQFFNGTSAACPIVAACALLVLQIYPNTSSNLVFGALASSVDKVPGGNPYYQNDTFGTRGDFLGYGRININNWILGIYNIGGPNNYCGTTDYNYYFTNLPSYLTVSRWSSSNANMPVDNTGLLRNIGGSPDETILTATISNICTEVSRYIVQGGFGREVYIYASPSDPNVGNFGFAGGDDPNQPLRVPNNYNSGIFMAVGYGPSRNKSVVYEPPLYVDPNTSGWYPQTSDITIISIVSAPSTWTAGISGMYVLANTSGDASGTLILQVQVPCGDQFNVSFTVIGF